MVRRPDPADFDKPLNRSELKELHRRLTLLSPYHVQDAYRKAHQQCCMSGDALPKAAAVQELVTAWKVLRDWERKGIGGFLH